LPVYEDLATITIDTDGRRPDEVALDVLAALTRPVSVPSNVSSVLVSPVGGTYFCYVGEGFLDSAAALVPSLALAEKAVIIEATEDPGTARRIADGLVLAGLDVTRVAIDDSEASKSFETASRLADKLAGAAVHRRDVIVAVGGEAIGEIAGFVSAIFNRGTPLLLVPTTLVAQADSSIGGKNAISLRAGRNLVGTFHQPVAVISDVAVAAYPGQRGFEAGLAEIAKHALITGPHLYEEVRARAAALVARDLTAVMALTKRSVQVKTAIVNRDEREQGDRIHLNYGHTFAHAIEQVRELDGGSSGVPLALGLMAAGHLGYRQGRLSSREVDLHRELLQSLGLPTSADLEFERMSEAWLRDKKYDHGVRFVVLEGIGKPQGGVPASDSELRAVFEDLRH
jgi:3-dehydroquinate synthetase